VVVSTVALVTVGPRVEIDACCCGSRVGAHPCCTPVAVTARRADALWWSNSARPGQLVVDDGHRGRRRVGGAASVGSLARSPCAHGCGHTRPHIVPLGLTGAGRGHARRVHGAHVEMASGDVSLAPPRRVTWAVSTTVVVPGVVPGWPHGSFTGGCALNPRLKAGGRRRWCARARGRVRTCPCRAW